MKYEPTTIKDIAKALGVSASTVSRALRDSYEISADTKKLVNECAKRLNYKPNPIALSLKKKRSKTIGIIVCEIANNFFSQVINGIEAVAYANGYNIIIAQSKESYEREILEIQNMAASSVDGILISLSTETNNIEHIKTLHDHNLPIVFFDRITNDIKTHCVIVDNFNGTYQATEHLIQNGYKKIAAITNSEFLSITNERVAGYKEALLKNGLVVYDKYVKHCFYGGMVFSEIEEAVNELLKLKEIPDAIICTSDKLTMGCLKTLKRRGIKIPDEIALAGFSNSELAELTDPAITTIRQPTEEIGKAATELLLQLIESKRPIVDFEKRILSLQVTTRASSMPKTIITKKRIKSK
jgi:LacI family transcriptional regulator